MVKKNDNQKVFTFILVIIGVILIAKNPNFLGAITGLENIERVSTSPKILVGQEFTMRYVATGAEGVWNATVSETFTSGGCLFKSTNTNAFTITINETTPVLDIIAIAPAQNIDCVLGGTFQFTDSQPVAFQSLSLKVCTPSCIRPTEDLCADPATVPDLGCGGDCTGAWTITRKTAADANCDMKITRSEVDVALNYFDAGIMGRDDLGIAIEAWANA